MSGSAYVESVGLIAPGLPSWQSSMSTFAGLSPYVPAAFPAVQPDSLPPNEQRRAPLGVRMALRAAEEAIGDSTISAATLASVFATSEADMEIIHRICAALAEPERSVSPTDFHNSVHNAASGYWSIAAAARGPSTTIAAYDFCCAVALREALGMLVVDDTDSLLVLYDVPPPPPLYDKRPIEQPVAVALVLSRERTPRSLARLTLCSATTEQLMREPGLEALRRANPAARALPLLQSLATKRAGVIGVREYDDRLLGIRVELP